MTEDQFPQAFIKREQTALGREWSDFVTAHAQASPISVRYNPHKSWESFQGEAVPWTRHGVYLTERPSFTLDPSFHAGKYYVQEASSMFLEQAFLQTLKGDTSVNVLDLCAAPGGKSTHLLSLMNPQSLLVSNEVIQSRSSILAENIQKWGHCNVVVTNNDAKDFQRLPGFFDMIVVDAPCSGEGLFRKDPHAVREWSEENVLLCSKRQRRILNDVWPALKTGGILIYSTCTYNQIENEENLKYLLETFDVQSVPLNIRDEWAIETVEDSGIIGYRFFPHRLMGEGFFISVLQKSDNQSESRLPSKSSFSEPSKKVKDQANEWVLHSEEKKLINRNDRVQFFPKNKAADIELMAKNIRVVLAGTFMTTIKHDKLIPEHALALSIDLNRDVFNQAPIDNDTALQYLRKDLITIQADKKGFCLLTYQNLPIGWVNVLDNRINNLYPSEWRIRMR
jgi:NOL1/NOP2/sun family putative RNA methylase